MSSIDQDANEYVLERLKKTTIVPDRALCGFRKDEKHFSLNVCGGGGRCGRGGGACR